MAYHTAIKFIHTFPIHTINRIGAVKETKESEKNSIIDFLADTGLSAELSFLYLRWILAGGKL